MADLIPPPTAPAGRTKRKRSAWRVALLSVVSVAAIAMAVWLPVHLRFREQMRAVATVERLGGSLYYHYDAAPDWLNRLQPDGVIIWSGAKPLGPNWLRRLLPAESVINYFLIVEEVSLDNGPGLRLVTNLSGEYQDHHPIVPADEDLIEVAKFKHLKSLYLRETPIGDAGLRHLKDLRDIEQLYVSFTQITDDSLDIVAGFENLKDLRLVGTKVTDAGIAKLLKLVQLEELDVSETSVTGEGLAPFRVRPGLSVIVDDPNMPFRVSY